MRVSGATALARPPEDPERRWEPAAAARMLTSPPARRGHERAAPAIANARTRAAYGRAVGQSLGWCAARGLGLRDISPLHVAAYIRTHPG